MGVTATKSEDEGAVILSEVAPLLLLLEIDERIQRRARKAEEGSDAWSEEVARRPRRLAH